ncbi:MAG: MBL fold metallo-hydrolase [Candidatus Hodarchaeota archaeon]
MIIHPHGGINEIGGNTFLIESTNTKILLDFGRSFKRENMYYSGFLQPRTSQGLKDLLEFNILPRIPQLYSKEIYINEGNSNSRIESCFLSHAHLDHFGNINLLNEGIPVFMGETAKTIIQSIQDTSRPRFGRSFIREATDNIPSNIITFRTGDILQISDFEITPVHVDHSLPGAYGFILQDINNNGRVIGYTGDLRLHGWRKDLTEDFIQLAKKKNLKALIMEGTNINEDFETNEERVQEDISQAVENTNGLAIANYSLRDIDRFRSFYLAAKENGRKLLINTKQAHLLYLLQNDPHLDIPTLEDDYINIYKRPKKRYFRWEQALFNIDTISTVESPRFDQTEYIFHCEFWNLTDLIDIQPQSTSTYFYSHGDPFDEEGIIDFNRLQEWINHFHLIFKQYHASGHAPQRDLKQIANAISPELLIPIHSEQPEMYKELVDVPVLLPKRGKMISI